MTARAQDALLPSLPEDPVPGEPVPPQRPLSRKGQITRARLLAAAKEIFEEDGFLEARISDIAERACVSHGTFYTYFDSKDEVFREVALEVEDELSSPLGEVIFAQGSVATPYDRIREAMRRYLEIYRREARLMGVIEQVDRHDEQLRAARSERRDLYGRAVTESIRQLQVRGLADPRLNPEIASVILGSMMERFPEMWLTEGRVDCDFEEGVEHLATIFLNALRIPAPFSST
ncbi:MAG: TetR/AcrR family transcriptional regulator [Acidimicrobiales bacterium]